MSTTLHSQEDWLAAAVLCDRLRVRDEIISGTNICDLFRQSPSGVRAPENKLVSSHTSNYVNKTSMSI